MSPFKTSVFTAYKFQLVQLSRTFAPVVASGIQNRSGVPHGAIGGLLDVVVQLLPPDGNVH